VSNTVVNRFKDADSLARGAAEEFVTRLSQLLAELPEVHIQLTGGTIGIATLAAIADREDAHLLEWSRVHVWWGDERFVESESSDRNAVQAKKAMLSKLPATNLHEFPASDEGMNLDEAANFFAAELATLKPKFSLAFVGMGPDGHICSLFPGKAPIAQGALVIAEHDSPKPPQERLSFSYEAMNSVDEIWFVVAGADKQDAVSVAFGDEPESLPVGRVHGKAKTIWFVDQAAGNKTWGC
jgi:6-phosphogluconolactonase